MATRKEIISQATPCTFGFQYTRRSQVIWPTSAEAALACAQAAPSQPEGCVTLLHHGMWVEEGPGWWGDLSAALMVTSDLRDIWRDTSGELFSGSDEQLVCFPSLTPAQAGWSSSHAEMRRLTLRLGTRGILQASTTQVTPPACCTSV